MQFIGLNSSSSTGRLAVGVHDGVCYVLNPALLRARAAVMQTGGPPRFISFRGGGCAGWAMEEEVAQVGQQLRCFEVCVLMCSSSTPAMRRAGKGCQLWRAAQGLGLSGPTADGTDAGCLVVDFGGMPGLPLLPTLNGWLLGCKAAPTFCRRDNDTEQ